MLVFPPTTVYGDDPSVPPVVQPLGLAYLGAYLEQEGHEVNILDGRGSREDTTRTPTYTRFGIPDEDKWNKQIDDNIKMITDMYSCDLLRRQPDEENDAIDELGF